MRTCVFNVTHTPIRLPPPFLLLFLLFCPAPPPPPTGALVARPQYGMGRVLGIFFLTIPHPCLFLPPLTKQPGQLWLTCRRSFVI